MAPLDVVAALVNDPGIAELDAWRDRDAVKERLEEILATRTAQDWLDVFLSGGVWAAKVRTTKEAVDELEEQDSDLIVTVEHPRAGTLRLIGCPIRFSATPWRLRLPPPLPGEHTDEVLAEVLSENELAALLRESEGLQQ